MGSLRFWSMLAILYQTLLCVIISWLTLSCKFEPRSSELYEVILMKFLYLYDPETCGKIRFYNLTSAMEGNRIYSSVVWPAKNHVATSFRTKIRLWLCLHLLWMFFSVVNVTLGARSCSFYLSLLPFSVTGVSLLITDVVNAILFLIDAKYTYNESAILRYLASKRQIRVMHKNSLIPEVEFYVEDTSWVAVLMAYVSMRGLVQWVVNFWIVKDNFYEGLEHYRRLRHIKARLEPKRSSFS